MITSTYSIVENHYMGRAISFMYLKKYISLNNINTLKRFF